MFYTLNIFIYLDRVVLRGAAPRNKSTFSLTYGQECFKIKCSHVGLLPTTMYLRQAGLTRSPTFSYLYCVRCRGQGVASEAPLERKYSRCMPGAKKSRGQWRPRWQRLFYAQISDDLEQRLFRRHCNVPRPSAEIEIARSANFFCGLTKEI